MTIKYWAAAAAAAAVALGAGAASAATVMVSANAGPWDASLNPGAHYGDGAQLAPTSVSITSGLRYLIEYVSGTTSTTPGNPYRDADGYTYFPPLTVNSPGQYTSTAPYLNALVGTFVDASGVIVGTPFVIGNGPLTVLAPTGASLLQLGINDDMYWDNLGTLQVSVSAVPEPATWAMMIIGFGAVGSMVRTSRRRNAFSAA